MNQHLRDRITRKLEAIPDDRAYAVLDYIEFLESRYAERGNPANVFTRFADTVEDGLRAGRVSSTSIAEAMGLMNKAMGLLGGVAAAGKSVASDIVATAREAGRQVTDLTRPPAKEEGEESATPRKSGDDPT
jgi:hypothetical protein